MYEPLDGTGPEIHVEMVLDKIASSNLEVSYKNILLQSFVFFASLKHALVL
jgi:hypothetical protein